MRLALIFISVACLLFAVSVVVKKVSGSKQGSVNSKAVNSPPVKKLG